ncbi:MAG: agmatine deiminase family protein [Patescibacteria group bacterium]
MSYRMPAEWEPHTGTWIAWPHNRDHWPGKFGPVPPVFVEIIAKLAESETVFLLVNDDVMEKDARDLLEKRRINLDQIQFFKIATNTSWVRDYGPLFVKNEKGSIIVTDWLFNSWGNKYPPFDLDAIVPQRISEQLRLPIETVPMVLEGGSIEVNGKGTLLTTEQCLLHPNRNPQLNRTHIETNLTEYLGATNILWLSEGIIGDDTDGHIDDLARFINPTTIVCAVAENTDDPDYKVLQQNYHDLKSCRDQDGNQFKIITLPMPDPVIYEGQRLPASYMNFYIANTVMLVPTFRCDKDQKVLRTLQKLFPTRAVIGIDCTDLIWGLGAIHCSTQQQPLL